MCQSVLFRFPFLSGEDAEDNWSIPTPLDSEFPTVPTPEAIDDTAVETLATPEAISETLETPETAEETLATPEATPETS